LALIAVPLLAYQPPGGQSASAGQPGVRGRLWFGLALAVCIAWGIQAYVLRFANQTMKSESIFFYMMATGLMLVPVALWMTDFKKPIRWGPSGPLAAAAIQSLNAIGALTMVYAFRYGKAIVVSPLINAVAPAITVLLSLLIYRTVPHRIVALGMLLAAVAFFLMA
jgi:drug/metabolite transporter (DMT)-like permease